MARKINGPMKRGNLKMNKFKGKQLKWKLKQNTFKIFKNFHKCTLLV